VRVEAVDVLRKPAQVSQLADAVARAQARLKRRASERAILRQATELFEASRDIVERLSDSLQSEALGIALGEPATGEFDHRVDVPLDGADVATLAATARLRRRVSQMVKSQTAKRTLFGAETAAGPSWNMLLDLYDKALDGRPVSVTSVCVASGVPATTALRRLEDLLASGLVRRVKDEKDGRRSMVELTDAAKERLKSFFDLTE
jgi:predicted transcriptional regulator